MGVEEKVMSPEVFVEILRESMFMVILLVSAVIVPSLIVGLIVAVFQAATSINEQTMSFLPRLLVTLLALSWGGNWLVQKLMDFTFHMVEQIPQVIG
ncbi:MAG: flagellar biosynthesis protein FliQ [Pseudomonadota bacterium]|nr:flagellar biosynthesis protein FliQ [Pseudomonadota bacterium]